MQSSHYLWLALELARERAAEADAHRLAASVRHPSSRGLTIRRVIARFALYVARTADAEVGQVVLSTR